RGRVAPVSARRARTAYASARTPAGRRAVAWCGRLRACVFRLDALARFPERSAPLCASAVQADVHMVAVGSRVVHVLAALAVLVVTGVVLHQHWRAREPGPAIPDHLLDAHSSREGRRVAEAVGREHQADQMLGGGAV